MKINFFWKMSTFLVKVDARVCRSSELQKGKSRGINNQSDGKISHKSFRFIINILDQCNVIVKNSSPPQTVGQQSVDSFILCLKVPGNSDL